MLPRRSENHGESFLAQFLQRFPFSSLRFPSKPIFSPILFSLSYYLIFLRVAAFFFSLLYGGQADFSLVYKDC